MTLWGANTTRRMQKAREELKYIFSFRLLHQPQRFYIKNKQKKLARIRQTRKCKFMAQKSKAEHEREKHPDCMQGEGWLKGFNFFK